MTPTAKATSPSDTASQSTAEGESCHQCVKVLRRLVSSIDLSAVPSIASALSSHGVRAAKDSPPLTLLKAIANDATEEPSSHGGTVEHGTDHPSQRCRQKRNVRNRTLETEDIPNGIRVKIPVAITDPSLLRRYSSLLRDDEENGWPSSNEDDGLTTRIPIATSSRVQNRSALAASTSAVGDTDTDEQRQENLEIEMSCKVCASTGPEGGARAFLMGPKPLSIVLCQNRIHSNTEEIAEMLTHELVHLYDVQTLQLDLQQCQNLAYSEVRAAREAECGSHWKQFRRYCVKQKAIRATNNMFPTEGRQCVQQVFAKAYDDRRPFQK